MTAPTVEFNPVQFCESLHAEAMNCAKSRLSSEPLPSQLQMMDLVMAFRKLRQEDYTNQFGLIAGEWNESIAIAKTYILAANHKACQCLHPELGLIFGTTIEEWGRFEELPKELRSQIHKAKISFKDAEDKFLDRINHFFNEMRVRASSLDTDEKNGVSGLIALYHPQARNACHKRDIEGALLLLAQMETDLHRLASQRKDLSRSLEQLMIKTQRDVGELHSFGNKGAKPKKKSVQHKISTRARPSR